MQLVQLRQTPPSPIGKGQVQSLDPLAYLKEKIVAKVGTRVKELNLEFDGEILIINGYSRDFHVKQLVTSVVMQQSTFQCENQIVVG